MLIRTRVRHASSGADYHLFWSGAALFVLTVFSGCARMTYNKVPSPVQWGPNWSAQKQAEADKMEGPRYYLPRPYLVLKSSIAVAARAAFVTFTYDKSSKMYKLISPPDATWVRSVLPESLTISQALAVKLEVDRAGQQQSATPGGTDTSPTTAPSGGNGGGAPPTSLTGRVGFINKEDVVTKLNDLFDVLYLPDFDEQYVVGRQAGFGKTDIDIQFRNGWAAETFGEKIDNSNLIPYMIHQVESASSAALNIATQWGLKAVGVPATKLPTAPASGAGQQQSANPGAEEQAALDVLGNLVMLKVVELRTAQPGLYPILKPREIYDWFGAQSSWVRTSAGGDAGLQQFIAGKGLAWIRPDQVFVPAPPVTMIGFNTTQTVLLGPATKDDLGIMSVRAPAPNGNSPTANDQLKAAVDKIRAALKTHLPPVLKDKINLDSGFDAKPNESVSDLIFVAIPATATFTADESKDALWKDWLGASFDLSGGQTVTVKPSDDHRQVVITVAASLDQLASHGKP